MIGARAATGYGEHVASEIAFGLAEQSVTVVSGAAYGIDGFAHRGALGANGSTIAVLACGVDVACPAGHAELLARIVAAGAVVSEYPPGTRPARLVSWCGIGSSRRWRRARSWWRPAVEAVRETPLRQQMRSVGHSWPCPGR